MNIWQDSNNAGSNSIPNSSTVEENKEWIEKLLNRNYIGLDHPMNNKVHRDILSKLLDSQEDTDEKDSKGNS